MERAVEWLVVINLLVVGLSHVLRPRAWVEYFIALREKETVGVYHVAFLHLPLGTLIVAFHNVWTGLPTIVTLLGWGWLVKGFLYFNFPRIGLRSLNRVSRERAHEFVAAGVVFLLLGATMLYSLLR